MPSLNRLVNGLLLQEDFSSANGWTAGTGFSRVADPTLVTFGATPSPLLQPGGIGSVDYEGVREGQLYIEGANWYLLHDAGDGTNGWLQRFATSTDRGYTWVKSAQPIGYNNGSGGSYASVATGWLEKRSSTYYMHRAIGTNVSGSPNQGLPAQPYFGDEWTSASINASYTFDLAYGPGTGWSSTDLLPGSVYLDGSTYRMFVEGNDGVNGWRIGTQTSSSPSGPWTLSQTVLFSQSDFTGPRQPENSKVFYHSGLSSYICLMNLISVDGTHTDRNTVVVSSSVTSWASSTKFIVQRNLAPCDTSGNIVGVLTHATGPDGALISEANYVPFVFDADPRGVTPGWHLGRSIRGGMLEPSANKLAYSDGSGSRNRYFKSLSHTDFVAEFTVDFSALATGSDISFEYRTDGTSGYRLVVRADAAAPRLLLQKMDGTTIQSNTTGTAVVEAGVILRIRVAATGTQQDAWIDGEHQINVVDSTYASGTQIAFSGHTVTGNVRVFHIRTSAVLTIKSLPANSTINVRSFGALPVAQVSSDSNGLATYTGTHFPVSRIDVPGSSGDAQTTDLLLWGGDTVEMAGFGWLRLAVAGLIFTQAQLTTLQTTWQEVGVANYVMTAAQWSTINGIFTAVGVQPAPPPVTDVQVPRDGPTLTDSLGGVWSLGTAFQAPYGNAILRNGFQFTPPQLAWGVMIEYTNGRLTHVNALGQRYLWNGAFAGTVWVPTATA